MLKTEEEFKMLAKKNPVIGEAYCRLQVMSEDEANRMLYEARLKAQRDEYSRVEGAWQEGWKKGWKEGWEEGRKEEWQEGWNEGRQEGWKEIIIQMNEHGMDAKAIAAVTHLSEGEVSALITR